MVSKVEGPAFRKVGEVAAELGLPVHVLRYWQSQFPALQPVRRNGHRYYRPDDVDLVRGIKLLRHQHGMTIEGTRRLLRQRGAGHVRALGRGDRVEVP